MEPLNAAIQDGVRRREKERELAEYRSNALSAIQGLKKLRSFREKCNGQLLYLKWVGWDALSDDGPEIETRCEAVALAAREILPSFDSKEFETMAEFERVKCDNPLLSVWTPTLRWTAVYLSPSVSLASPLVLYSAMAGRAWRSGLALDQMDAYWWMSPLRIPLCELLADVLCLLPPPLVGLVVSFLAIPSASIEDPARKWLAHYVDVTTQADLKNVRDADVTEGDGAERAAKRARVQ